MPQSSRSTRFEARIAPDALVVLKRAAELQGRSLSDFVVAAAQAEAERTISEAHVIRLSVADQIALAEALIDPAPPTEDLLRLRDMHQRLISDGR